VQINKPVKQQTKTPHPMINKTIKLAVSSAMLLGLLSSSAFADIKLNDSLTISGYLSGSYAAVHTTPGTTTDSLFKGLPSDSSQLLVKGTFAPVTAVASLYFVPNSSVSETNVLDANLTYDAGGGLSVTGGRFLSYMGYESFFTANNPEISFANGDFLGAIPGFHEGIRADYTSSTWTGGVALVDSLYNTGALKGDSELRKNAGLEGYFAFKGVTDLTIWAGVGYEYKGNLATHNTLLFDLWAEYALSKTVKLAAEYADKDGGTGNKGYNWLALANFTASDKASVAVRVSGEKMKNGGPEFTRGTIAPAYALTDKLTIRAEYTYTDYNNFGLEKANFYGLQAFLKF
jgi:hypothetical protein